MGSLANLKLLVGLVEAGVLPPVDLDPRQWVDGLSGLAILKEPSEQEIFQLKDFCRLVHDKQVTPYSGRLCAALRLAPICLIYGSTNTGRPIFP
jgi:hypothetical protein